jgi:excisionase family DNA binding protein
VAAEYVKIPELAHRLDVSEKTARRYVKEGKLPSVFIGGAFRVSEEDLKEFLEGAKVDPGIAQAPLPLNNSEERGSYPYPWMSDILAHLIDEWERSIEAEQVEGRYAHAVAIAAMDAIGSIRDRGALEEELGERNRLYARLYNLCSRAIDRYRESDVFKADKKSRDEERRLRRQLSKLRAVA